MKLTWVLLSAAQAGRLGRCPSVTAWVGQRVAGGVITPFGGGGAVPYK